jgi:hypothetical protein
MGTDLSTFVAQAAPLSAKRYTRRNTQDQAAACRDGSGPGPRDMRVELHELRLPGITE